MTFLGRVFILIILVSSASFFVAALLANASHMDYREKLTKFRTENEQLKTTINATKSANEKLQTILAQEQIARRAALAALQSQLDNQNQQLAENYRQLSSLTAINTMKNQEVSSTVDLLKATQTRNDTLRTENDKVINDRNSVLRSVITLTDNLNSLKSAETDLRDQLKDLQDQATYFEALAETRGATLKSVGITEVEDVPPADLRGEVLAINSNNSVEVSLGKDDGIREGHTLEVFRGAQYLGRIQITKAQDDKAIGKVLASYRKGYIQAGDKVASKIQ